MRKHDAVPMKGPDLPSPEQGFTVEQWRHRWPVAVEKTELVGGVIIFVGEFDSRDVETAQRTYPGRRALLTETGHIEVHPARS